MALVDVVYARHTTGRWLILHSLANLAITIFSLQDFYATLIDPVNSCNAAYSLVPVYGIAALHLYHILAFRNLSTSEWIHHLLFGGAICTIGILFASGPLQNFIAFFICGLPGGIDYLLLFLVKQGIVQKLEEKVSWTSKYSQ